MKTLGDFLIGPECVKFSRIARELHALAEKLFTAGGGGRQGWTAGREPGLL